MHERDVHEERRQDEICQGSSLDGNVRRAIDIHEDEKVDEAALKDLIHAARRVKRVGIKCAG
jgi:hypothetical protein